MRTGKEFNRENVLEILDESYKVVSDLATEYCDAEYNEAVFRIQKILQRTINTIIELEKK